MRRWGTRGRTAVRALREGDTGAVRATLERGLFPAAFFRRNQLVILTLTRPQPPRRFLPGFALRWGSRRDIADLTLIRDRPEDFDAFFAAGNLCLIGEVDRIPVSFSWLELDRDHVSRPNAYRFQLAPGSAWAFGCEVRTETDAALLFHLHWYRKMQLLSRGGIDRVYLAIQGDCPSSRLAHARVGFSPVFRMRILRLAGAIFHQVDSLIPGRGLESGRLRVGAWRGSSPAPGPSEGKRTARAVAVE